jgi:hypothetical protein
MWDFQTRVSSGWRAWVIRRDALRALDFFEFADGQQNSAGWRFESERWSHRVWFTTVGSSSWHPHVADAASPPTVILGLAAPYALARVEAPVSPRLRQGSERARRFMLGRFEGVSPVKLRFAAGAPPAALTNIPSAAFFTGGVDSLYSAMQLHKELDALVYVHGFDVPLENFRLFASVLKQLEVLAASLDLPLKVVRTNLRMATNCFAPWGKLAFGGALASVAHVLAGEFSRVVIPSSSDEETHMAYGSMPELDPLWSSESVEIVHHGFDASRLRKVEELRHWPEALQNLRVCWRNPDDVYNCGRCEKCLRTLVLLEMAGLSERVRSFPVSLDLERVASIRMSSFIALPVWRQILRMLSEDGGATALRSAVHAMVSANERLLQEKEGTWRR